MEEQVGSGAFESTLAGEHLLSRRSQLEIQMDVLRAVREGARAPTQIMYRANLAWIVLQYSLRRLTETGFLSINENGTRRRYEITTKGSGTLDSYDNILKGIQLQQRAIEQPRW